MRVTNASTSRNFSASVNEVHQRLNKSMDKISTGKAYSAAAENPLAYYEGKKIDNQYQDVLSKMSLITDVKNRLYQQELGARDIQSILAEAKTKVQYARTETSSQDSTLDTLRQDLLQKQQAIVNDLNAQFQDFYIYGGNDLSTPPFSLSEDGMTLTFTHTFPGDTTPTEIEMELTKQTDGSYKYEITKGDVNTLKRAMEEQGRVDIGYGSSDDINTLLDTYTGGFNLLTGVSSDAIRADKAGNIDIMKKLNNSALTLIGSAAMAIGDYINTPEDQKADAKGVLDDVLADTIDSMTEAEHMLSTSYSDLGNKYSLLEDTESKLTISKNSLTEQYTDKLGADPYESIIEMYNYRYSYNAALQVGSQLFGSSLFDFVK